MHAHSLVLKTLLVIFLACGSKLEAAILLEVDSSNPAGVTISSTGFAPLVDDMSSVGLAGVTLRDFFDPGFEIDVSLVGASSLVPHGSVSAYLAFTNTWALLLSTDLNIFVGSITSETQNFLTSQPAFTGSVILDLSAAAASLPGLGFTGNIIVGDTGTGSGAVIGQWRVIPEPSSASLLLGVLVFTLARRHRALG